MRALTLLVAGCLAVGSCSTPVDEETTTTTTVGISTTLLSPPSTAPPAAPSTAAVVIPTVTIVNGEVQGGPQRLQVSVGREIAFNVVSDVAEEIHVHGFDLLYDVAPGVATEVRFVADLPGIFEVELHGSHTIIAVLTVS